MNAREVYIEAAKWIASGREEFSCIAVDRVQGKRFSQARQVYSRTMRNDERYLSYADIFNECWEKVRDGVQDMQSKRMRNFRVWLLCMMAACCEDLEGKRI